MVNLLPSRKGYNGNLEFSAVCIRYVILCSLIQGLPIDDFAQEKLDATAKELCEERDDAIAACQD